MGLGAPDPVLEPGVVCYLFDSVVLVVGPVLSYTLLFFVWFVTVGGLAAATLLSSLSDWGPLELFTLRSLFSDSRNC